MSMELYCLSDRPLSSIAEWQRTIDEEGFPLRLDTSRSFANLSGYLPVILSGDQVGFECDHWSAKDILDGYSNINFGRQWRSCLAFRWGADFKTCIAAYMGAAAYAKATNGVVLECEQGAIHSWQQTRELARTLEKQKPSFEKVVQAAQSALAKKLGLSP